MFAGVMLLAWLVSGSAHRVLGAALAQPIGRALLVFLLVAATGMMYGEAAPSSRAADYISWRRLAYALPLLGLFWAPQWKWRFVKAFVLVAATGMVASYLSKAGWVPAKAGNAPGVLLQNHAMQGITFAVALLCALLWRGAAHGRARWTLLSLAMALAANIALVTPSRSGYLALLVVLVTWLWSTAGWRRASVGTLLVVVALAGTYSASPLMRQRVDQAISESLQADDTRELTSMGTRVLFYRTAWEMIQKNPLLGYGSGGFAIEYGRIVQQRYTDWRATPSSDPHNIYLMLLVSHGLPGLMAFAFFLVVALRHAPPDLFGRIGAGSLMVIAITSLFSSHFRTFPEGHLIGMFAGAMLAMRVPSSRG